MKNLILYTISDYKPKLSEILFIVQFVELAKTIGSDLHAMYLDECLDYLDFNEPSEKNELDVVASFCNRINESPYIWLHFVNNDRVGYIYFNWINKSIRYDILNTNRSIYNCKDLFHNLILICEEIKHGTELRRIEYAR